MEIAIAGKKYSGKTTIFEILTSKFVDPHKREVNEGMVEVPDERIDYLYNIYKPLKKVYAKFKLLDLPGVEKEKFFTSSYLNNFKNSDAIIYVIRTFKNLAYPAEENLSPSEEIEQFEEEAILSDLAIVESRINKVEKMIKKRNSKDDQFELKTLLKIKKHLESLNPLRSLDLTEKEEKLIKGFTFLSKKPILYVLNIDESEIDLLDQLLKKFDLEKFVDSYHKFSFICASIERELMELETNEKIEFMKSYGLKEEAKKRLMKEAFSLLGLITFFTYGSDEVRAWPIKKGTIAKKAAGTIHSDIERGFIKAEVFHYNDLVNVNGKIEKLKEMNLIRLEGKEYVVKDGDMIIFRFNV